MSMPDAFLNAGSKCPNRPDCSVEVVEAIVIDCAQAVVVTEKTAITASRLRFEKWFTRAMLSAFLRACCWGFASYEVGCIANADRKKSVDCLGSGN